MIRVAIVDDHSIARYGVERVLVASPDGGTAAEPRLSPQEDRTLRLLARASPTARSPPDSAYARPRSTPTPATGPTSSARPSNASPSLPAKVRDDTWTPISVAERRRIDGYFFRIGRNAFLPRAMVKP